MIYNRFMCKRFTGSKKKKKKKKKKNELKTGLKQNSEYLLKM